MSTKSEESHEYLFSPRRVGPAEREIGGYRLLHELGTGGMATLYLGTDVAGRLLAIKRLHPHLANDATFVAMFHDEADIAGHVNHPNVARVLQLDRVGDELLIVMEYVHGESLAALFGELARQGQRIPVEAALHLIGQACLGLHAAHEQRNADGVALEIIHRDLSPHNLLVTYEGELKIVDFGIAKAKGQLHRTETGMIKGKLAYLSPEQAAGEPVDARSDVYSLGLVLYEALCGVRAINGDNPVQLLHAAHAGAFRAAGELRSDLPSPVVALLERALAREPAQRYESAAALYRDIYLQLTSGRPSITTQALGELVRRVFGRRYALREELRALALQAPDVLAEEELALVDLDAIRDTHRCEHCGLVATSAAALEEHAGSCVQRRWWEHNFSDYDDAAGDAQVLRDALARARSEESTDGDEQPRASLWSRLKERFSGKREDPLVARLRAVEARLVGIRDRRTAELTRQGTAVLWQLVHEVTAEEQNAAPKNQEGQGLLGRLKPRVTHCANALLALALELEATRGYRAAMARLDLTAEIESLEQRHAQATDESLRSALSRTLARKRALATEQRDIQKRQELLDLRLEAMVDALGVTLGKVARITSSSAFADARADTQITVFMDSLVLQLDLLGDSLHEIDAELRRS